jgi:hypothetical protein
LLALLRRRKELDMGFVSFIVMEPGSQWPGHVGSAENLVVVGVREDNEELPLVVRAKLDTVRRRGESVRVGVLACNGATDETSKSRRVRVARELLAAVACAGFGRLVLTTGSRASSALRHDLLELCEQLRGSSAIVSVRFPEQGRPALDLVPNQDNGGAPHAVGGVALETA